MAIAQRAGQLSIVIPVHNGLPFTKQCLDRIRRNTPPSLYDEIIIVDGASTDGTHEYIEELAQRIEGVVYHRCPSKMTFGQKANLGADLSEARRLLFLNNDTLVQPGWLDNMIGLMDSDSAIGLVGIQQLFPYTRVIYHTGIVITADRGPEHIYAFSDASLPHVNRQREYQVVNGACFLIDRSLFKACGGFDDYYVDGYEDIDLCMAVRALGRKVYCCTSAYIYHYGQMTRGKSTEDARNSAYFYKKWGQSIRVDDVDYYRMDGIDVPSPAEAQHVARPSRTSTTPIYFLDDLSTGNALTWAIANLASALTHLDRPVYIREGRLSDTIDAATRQELAPIMAARPDPEAVQVKWSHYWPQHLDRDLTGSINLELFVINYLFNHPEAQPWDYWIQTLRQDGCCKLPLTQFCRDVLMQVGVAAAECHVLSLGYSKEVLEVEPSRLARDQYRFLTLTNSFDLERYGTELLLDAYIDTFTARDPVTMVVKDYGATSGNGTLRALAHNARGRARIEFIDTFLDKKELIRLYRSCDAFVSAHRGEGFGMKILDAMACGLPVIAPLFGGPTDYCTASNCFPVAFGLAPIGECLDSRSLRITNGPIWCEPDASELAKTLRFVLQNPSVAAAVGEQGRRDVVDRFTWDNAGRKLVQIVDSIQEA